MEFADDAAGRRVPARAGNRTEEWHCIECGQPVYWRRPSFKKTSGPRAPVVPFFSHFPHRGDDVACDARRSREAEPESEAHIQMKQFFKTVFPEAAIEYRGIAGVRPDVFTAPLAIEVQHSYISETEIARRNHVYWANNLFVWWVFDADVFALDQVPVQEGMTWWLTPFEEPLPPEDDQLWERAFEATLARDPRLTGWRSISYPFPAGV